MQYSAVVGIVTLTLGLLAAPLAVKAQPSAHVPRIGLLSIFAPAVGQSKAESFREGLREVGYLEGKNILIETRWAEGHRERFAELAADLVRMQVAVLVTDTTPVTLAAMQATQTIPIVMITSGDPVEAGLVASLARPGGNVTGLTFQAPALSGKRLELLKEAAPQTTLVAVLWNAVNPSHVSFLRETEAARRSPAARRRGAQPGRSRPGVCGHSAPPSALITLADGMLVDNRTRIVAFAAQHRLPAVFPDRDFAEAGGLMTYGPNLAANFRRAAYYVDRILKGAQPADLPVEQPMKLDLVLNLKTAQALGLTIPPMLLFQADEVIR